MESSQCSKVSGQRTMIYDKRVRKNTLRRMLGVSDAYLVERAITTAELHLDGDIGAFLHTADVEAPNVKSDTGEAFTSCREEWDSRG